MKKIIFLLFILFLFSSDYCLSQSGWYSKFFNNVNTISEIVQRDNNNFIALCGGKYYFKSSDDGNTWLSNETIYFDSAYNLSKGQFINSQTGWLIGSNSQYYGVILKTTNGGTNWFRQNTGLGNWLCYSLFFMNENTGWIGTTNGSTIGWLIKTTNGGVNWTKQEFPGSYSIRYVKFFDVSNGWILGDYIAARTTNGGLNWENKTINNIPHIYVHNTNMCALSINESWSLTISHDNGGLIYSNFLKTTDGGNNWSLMYSYTDYLNTNAHSFYDITFTNSSTGFLSGYFNFIVRTTNSGLNWMEINTVNISGTYPSINSLLPVNSNDVFVGGGYSGQGSYAPFNYIYKSTNTGSNWIIKNYNWHYSFTQMYFNDNNTGYVSCDTGRIFKTINGGNNWNLVYNNNNLRILGISFGNHTTGFVYAYAPSYSYRILKTTNKGENWNEVLNTSREIHSVKFYDQYNGFAGSDSNHFYRTTNSGLNWSYYTLPGTRPNDILDISFINNSTGWMLGHFYIGIYPYGSYEWNAFWKTTNGGNNWSLVYDSVGYRYNYKVQFLDSVNGYKLTYTSPVLYKSTNAGNNWFAISNPLSVNPVCMFFMNTNTGWIGGNNGQSSGLIIKTTNGGQNWILQLNEYRNIVSSIFALDENDAWFCGRYSSIYNTTNGGGMIIGINNNSNKDIPINFSLSQNYPNPFNPVTRIKFSLPNPSKGGAWKNVRLVIYDILGREVTSLIPSLGGGQEGLKPGSYEVTWDGSRYASGVYFYRLITDEFVETKKMVLIK